MIKKKLTYNNAKIQTQNMKTTTQTPYIMKNYINIKKIVKHEHTMFWNLKSPLKSPKLI